MLCRNGAERTARRDELIVLIIPVATQERGQSRRAHNAGGGVILEIKAQLQRKVVIGVGDANGRRDHQQKINKLDEITEQRPRHRRAMAHAVA